MSKIIHLPNGRPITIGDPKDNGGVESKTIKNEDGTFTHVVPAEEFVRAGREIAEYREIKRGVEFVRAKIIEHDPTFFDILKSDECMLSGWDLIADYVKKGIDAERVKQAEAEVKKDEEE